MTIDQFVEEVLKLQPDLTDPHGVAVAIQEGGFIYTTPEHFGPVTRLLGDRLSVEERSRYLKALNAIVVKIKEAKAGKKEE